MKLRKVILAALLLRLWTVHLGRLILLGHDYKPLTVHSRFLIFSQVHDSCVRKVAVAQLRKAKQASFDEGKAGIEDIMERCCHVAIGSTAGAEGTGAWGEAGNGALDSLEPEPERTGIRLTLIRGRNN